MVSWPGISSCDPASRMTQTSWPSVRVDPWALSHSSGQRITKLVRLRHAVMARYHQTPQLFRCGLGGATDSPSAPFCRWARSTSCQPFPDVARPALWAPTSFGQTLTPNQCALSTLTGHDGPLKELGSVQQPNIRACSASKTQQSR